MGNIPAAARNFWRHSASTKNRVFVMNAMLEIILLVGAAAAAAAVCVVCGLGLLVWWGGRRPKRDSRIT